MNFCHDNIQLEFQVNEIGVESSSVETIATANVIALTDKLRPSTVIGANSERDKLRCAICIRLIKLGRKDCERRLLLVVYSFISLGASASIM
ncbi:hypothetical protein D3C72_1382620 [compost metagenome]